MSVKNSIAQLTSDVASFEHDWAAEEAAAVPESKEEKPDPYATDLVRFISECCYTFDPKRAETDESPHLPFKLFPRQEELARWFLERLAGREDGLVEKSRQIGASWLFAAIAVWAWLYRPGFVFGLGSRKEALVDKRGDPKTLFWKIRYIIGRLPPSMLPKGYDPKRHDRFLLIENPETGAAIVGEGGDNMGRGGTYTVYIGDEWAFVPRANTVKAAISEATNCFIRLSTPNGLGNDFAETRFSGRVPVFTYHWRDDPRKGYTATRRRDDGTLETYYPWYEAQIAKKDAVTVAQEIDIDYTASIEGIFIPARYVQASVELDLPRDGPRRAGGDFAGGGKAEHVYTFRQGPVVVRLDAWKGEEPTAAAHTMARKAAEDKAERFYYDADGVGSGVAGVYRGYEQKVPFAYIPINGASSPTTSQHDDAPNIRAKERFRNLRAELWWSLYVRFRKTWEYVNGRETYPLDELISIPNDAELIQQLSMPLRVPNNTGKIQVESKKDMRKRGVKSPDRADSLVYCFAHVEPDAGGGALASFRDQPRGGGLASIR